MKKLGLLMLAVLMISLSSCGGDDANKAKDAANEAVENTQQAAEQATETTEDAAQATEEAAEKTEEAAKDAAAGVDGKALFLNNGCVACHQVDKKTVGPALKEVAAAYADKKDDLVKFLKGEGQAVVDPENFAQMKPNLEITKKMSDDERGALADYILSLK